MRVWQTHQEASNTCILVQHRRNQDAIVVIPSPPAPPTMGAILRNSEIAHLRILLNPGLEMLNDAARQRTTRVKDPSICAEQQHHLPRRLAEMNSLRRLSIEPGLLLGLTAA